MGLKKQPSLYLKPLTKLTFREGKKAARMFFLIETDPICAFHALNEKDTYTARKEDRDA